MIIKNAKQGVLWLDELSIVTGRRGAIDAGRDD
jgi:hypothetical protein